MANTFDQFDNPVVSGARDVGTALTLGANDILGITGNVAKIVTGKDNFLTELAKKNAEALQLQKSPELIAAEQDRDEAVAAEPNLLYAIGTYVKKTASDPRLFTTTVAQTAPSSIGPGVMGAGAKMVAGKLLAKKGTEFATKVGLGTAIGTGVGMQAADVGGQQMDDLLRTLEGMDDQTAMQIPQVADLVKNKGYSIPEAKAAAASYVAMQTAFGAGAISALTQLIPGAQTIEKAIVGGTEKAAGKTLLSKVAAAGKGAVKGAVGETFQEVPEEGGGQYLANVLARQIEPERELTAGVAPAIGQAIVGAGTLGAIAGAKEGAPVSRQEPTPRPVPESEAPAGMSGEPPVPAATKPSLAPQQQATLERSEDMTSDQFWATVNIRQARLLGGEPNPEDVRLVGEVPPPRAVINPDVMNGALDEAYGALNDWRADNPNAPENIVLIFDPEMLHNGYGIQGAFNPKDGAIFINTAFVSPENIGKIVSHEWAHSTLATNEGRQALADFASREIPQADLDALATRYGTQDRLTLLEEWIAENQEKAPGVISRIVARIREWLSNFGIVNLNDREVADIMLRTLREQAENKVQPDVDQVNGPVEVDPNSEIYDQFSSDKLGAPAKFALQKLPTAADVTDAKGNLRYTIPKKTLDVSHYSFVPDLTEVDPAYYGTGRGEHYHRMMKGINKSFFFVGNSKPKAHENVAGKGMNRYRTTIDSSRIYDMDKDPLDLWFAPNPQKSEGLLKELGYDGFLAKTDDGRSFVALFYPTSLETGEVTRAAQPVEEAVSEEPQESAEEYLARVEREEAAERRKALRRASSGKYSLTQEQQPKTSELPSQSEILTRSENEAPRAIRSFYENFVHPDARGGQEIGGVAAGGDAPGAGAERSGIQSRAAAVDSGELTGTGRGFTSFFSDVSAGKRGTQNTGKKYTPVISLSDEAKNFAAVRQKYRGNFDNHIATSIPGFEEVQTIVGKSIVDSYPEGATMLDIGASEGALIKAITESSDGKILTIGLDPNVQMASHFAKNPVKGSDYLVEAYGSKSDEGKPAWTEDDGTEIKYYDPKGQTFDVIHEAMVFQFISNARNAQVQRMKQLLKPDGVVILEEKLANRGDVYRLNEEKKDRYKSQYYTPEEMEKKRQEVLQAGGDKVEGMTQLQVSAWELEEALAKNFQHVAQFWDSGNFKGYVASDSREALDRLLSNIDSTETEYSTVSTPRDVTPPKAGGTKFSLAQTKTPEFRRWFKESVATDENGRPQVYYHGTPDFSGTAFKPSKAINRTGNVSGYYFTPDAEESSFYATGEEGAQVIPVYLSIQNPFIPGKSEISQEMIDQYRTELENANTHLDPSNSWFNSKIANMVKTGTVSPNALNGDGDAYQRVLKAGGYDGFQDGRHLVAFEPTQIKSSIGNLGTFDPENPDFRYSLSQQPVDVSATRLTREVLGLPPGEARVSKDAVAKALNDFSRDQLKGYDFSDDQIAIAHGILNAVAEGRSQLLLGDKSGADWYDTDIDTAKKYLRRALPGLKTDTDMVLFTAVMTPTSFGQNPLTNVAAAVRIYEAAGDDPWGNLPPRQENGKGWTARATAVELAIGRLNQLINDRGERGAVNWLLKKHPVSELREYNDNVSGKANDMKYGAYIFGPKGGPFFLNMNGVREEMTKDLWWSRTFNRWFGTMEETVADTDVEDGLANEEGTKVDDPGGFKIQEVPRNDAERRRMDAIAKGAADELGLTIEELQATLWYYEQQLWKRLGAKVESYSFKDGALRILQKRGIEAPRVRRSNSPAEERRQAAYLLAAAGGRAGPAETAPTQPPPD